MVAASDTEFQPTVGEHVEERRRLGQAYRVVMEDDISIEYEAGEGPSRAVSRMSFSERAILDRLDLPPPATWADGSERFES